MNYDKTSRSARNLNIFSSEEERSGKSAKTINLLTDAKQILARMCISKIIFIYARAEEEEWGVGGSLSQLLRQTRNIE